MATTSPPQKVSEEIKAELEKSKNTPVSNKSDSSSSTPKSTVIKTKDTEIIDKRESEGNNSNQSQNKKSSGIGETFGNFVDAITKSGSFKDSKDGILRRIGTVLNNSDDMTSMFLGAGMTAGALGLINSIGGGDDDNDDEDLENRENRASSKAFDDIRKRKEESQTIASRIEAAMNEQNVANNLAGSGIMMRQLAMISIKTQESLMSIVEYIQKSTKSTNSYLTKLKEAIEDIDEDSGSVFQGLFPLLIGGLMAAITGFFGEGEEGKTFLETLIDKVSDPIINKVKELLGIDKEKGFLEGIVDNLFVSLGIDKEKAKDAIDYILNLFSGIPVNKVVEFINFLIGNKEKFQKIIDNIEGNLKDFFDSIDKISGHSGEINQNLKIISDFIRSFIGEGGQSSFPSIDMPQDKSSEDEEDKPWYSPLTEGVDKISFLWKGTKYLEEKLAGTKEILKEFTSSIKILAPLIDDNKRKELFNKIADDFTSVFENSIKRISGILEEELKPKIDYIVNSLPTVKNILGEKNFNALTNSFVTAAASKSFELFKSSGLKEYAEEIKAQKNVELLDNTDNNVSTPYSEGKDNNAHYKEIINGLNEIKQEIKKIGKEENAIATSLSGIDSNITNLKEITISGGETIINSTAQAIAASSIPQRSKNTVNSVSAEELANINSVNIKAQ